MPWFNLNAVTHGPFISLFDILVQVVNLRRTICQRVKNLPDRMRYFPLRLNNN